MSKKKLKHHPSQKEVSNQGSRMRIGLLGRHTTSTLKTKTDSDHKRKMAEIEGSVKLPSDPAEIMNEKKNLSLKQRWKRNRIFSKHVKV